MGNGYIVTYQVGKGYNFKNIWVYANDEEQAKKVALIQIRCTTSCKNPRIITVHLDIKNNS